MWCEMLHSFIVHVFDSSRVSSSLFRLIIQFRYSCIKSLTNPRLQSNRREKQRMS